MLTGADGVAFFSCGHPRDFLHQQQEDPPHLGNVQKRHRIRTGTLVLAS